MKKIFEVFWKNADGIERSFIVMASGFEEAIEAIKGEKCYKHVRRIEVKAFTYIAGK